MFRRHAHSGPRVGTVLGMLLAALALTACGGGGGGGGGSDNARAAVGPSVKVVYPDRGDPAGGDTITIITEGFTHDFTTFAPTVQCGPEGGGVQAVRANVVEVQTPPCSEGPVDVLVKCSACGESALLEGGFRYAFPVARLVSIAPPLGDIAGGEIVTISTQGFTADFTSDPVEIFFGGALAQIAEPGTGLFRVYSPPNDFGAVDVTVHSPSSGQTAILEDCFRYEDVQPGVVVEVFPVTGSHAGGSKVIVRTADFGDNFLQYLPKVFFGTDPADVTALDARTLEATTPANPGGLVDVRVESSGYTQAAALASAYQYDWPQIVSISPTDGSLKGGTVVVISVRNFVDDFTAHPPAVTFGGMAAASVRVVDDSRLEVVTPAHAGGAATVRVDTTGFIEGVERPNGFFFGAAAIVRISPNEGAREGGLIVQIDTADFVDDFTVHLPRVEFGGIEMTTVRARSATGLEIVTLPGVKGAVDVVIDTTGEAETIVAEGGFVYAPPELLSVLPECGPAGGGTTVTITTNDFDGDFRVNLPEVSFGGTPATSVTAVDATTVEVVAPVGNGSVDVTVELDVAGEAATFENGYNYIRAGGGD